METKPGSFIQEREAYTRLNQHKNTKKVFGDIPFEKKAMLVDISIKGRSKEDQLFARDPFLRANLRRGVSFLKEENSNGIICRRGLQKFFDLKHEYLDLLDEKTLQTYMSRDDEKLYRVIFEEAQGVLKRGGRIVVYKTEKANGENAQVSYSPKYNAWVCASKNVSILIRNNKDIDEYKKYGDNRYSFATLIAETWLKIISKEGVDVEGLKKDLTGKTLVGEYCGNPLYQHLVEYKEITILFYALVDHLGDRSCLPIKTFQDLTQKYNLPFVRMTPRKECSNIRDFVDILAELSKEVSENTIEEDQEGSVLYFEGKFDDKVEILSLCKLKTLEYRLYRKLREKLKYMIKNGTPTYELMKKYTNEVEELCKVYKPPKPLEHYYEIAKIAFTFVSENSNIAKNLGLTNRYLTFLKIIQKCHAEKVKPQVSHFQTLLDNQVASEESDIEDEKETEEAEKSVTDKSKINKQSEKDDGKERKRSKGSFEEESQGQKNAEKYTEEKKIEEPVKKEVKTGKGLNLPKRIIIITPPMYFDFDQRAKIVENSGVKGLGTEWNEILSTQEKRTIILLNKFPRITKPSEIQHNSIFIIVGFEQENMKSTVRKLEDLAIQKERFQFSGDEFMFVQSKDKQRSVENLWKNFEQFKEKIHQILPNNYHIVHLSKPDKIKSEIDMAFEKLGNFQANLNLESNAEQVTDAAKDNKDSNLEEASKKSKSQILVFIPIGIPGMGKTTFLNILKKLLEEKGCAISIISSDVIRKNLIEETLQKEPHISESKAFEKTAKFAKTRFFDDVEKAILKTKTLTQKTHIVFLDKNHPPSIIKDTIEFFEKPKFLNKFDIRTVVIKPSCHETFRTNSHVFPFSLTFFFTCLRRAIGRDNHETLKGGDLNVSKVLISFLNSYKDFKPTENYFRSLGAQFVMELPFTHEDPEVEKAFPKTLVMSLSNALQSIVGFDPDLEKVAVFLEEFSKLTIELKNPDPELLYQKSLENLNKCFQLFNNN